MIIDYNRNVHFCFLDCVNFSCHPVSLRYTYVSYPAVSAIFLLLMSAC